MIPFGRVARRGLRLWNGSNRRDLLLNAVEPQRKIRVERETVEPHTFRPAKRHSRSTGQTKPWPRIEQALRVTDLLLQAGGFSAIVLDLRSIAPEHVSRIPLATWFRYGAAAERSRTSVLLKASITLRDRQPASFVFRGCRYEVEHAYGPWLTEGDWWNHQTWALEQWDLMVSPP